MNLIQVPETVKAVFDQFFTCEFTTLGKGGVPVSWPTLPMYVSGREQFVIMTPLGLAQKTFNIRREPRVSLLFSEPSGSSLDHPPAVLVQGEAQVSDGFFTSLKEIDPVVKVALGKQARKLLQRQPAVALYTGNPLARYLMDWYFMRLVITITPSRIRWWEGGAVAGGRGQKLPLAGTAPVIGPQYQQDGFPWRAFLKNREDFTTAVLSAVDGTGYPASVRVKTMVGEAGDLRLDSAVGTSISLDLQPGPACLLYHRHDERLWNLKSFVVRGALECDTEGWFLRPEKFIPGMGIGGLPSYVRFVRDGRRNTKRYLEKRGLPRPKIPRGEISEMMQWAKPTRERRESK